MLEEAGVGYVLVVPKSLHVRALGHVDFAITRAPDDAWERHSKGSRVYDRAVAKLLAIADFDGDQLTHDRWVLARVAVIITAKPKVTNPPNPTSRRLSRLRKAPLTSSNSKLRLEYQALRAWR